MHGAAEVLTPNQLLSFPKGQSAALSAAKQGRKIENLKINLFSN